MNELIKEKLNSYELENLEEFEPKFYYQNLTNGYKINKKAVENLYTSGYTKAELILIDNYDELGIVEYVADNQFYIKNNHIYIDD